MKVFLRRFRHVAVLALALGPLAGCESTDSGASSVSGGVYYGAGFYDTWYYGDYDYDMDVIVTPPDRPTDPGDPPRPAHPIAPAPPAPPRPAQPIAPTPTPRPAPSIPSMPRAAPSMGGRR